MEKSCKDRKIDSGKNFAGFIILGLGILFLLVNWGVIPSLGKTWPLILIVVGLAFLLGLGEKEKGSPTSPSQPEEPKSN